MTTSALSCRGLVRGGLLCLATALAACASGPPAPEWQLNAHGASQKAQNAYLAGDARVERLEWDLARREVARTGRPDLLARVELLRCAGRVASLVFEPCSGFEALSADATAAEKAYARYLAGEATANDLALLPATQREAAQSTGANAAAPLSAITDPLSRLVAAGVQLRTGRATPGTVALAVETASVQGWRRPLLAWLVLERERAQAAGDTVAAAAVQRRIAIVEQGGLLR